jgi:hypothetical protein
MMAPGCFAWLSVDIGGSSLVTGYGIHLRRRRIPSMASGIPMFHFSFKKFLRNNYKMLRIQAGHIWRTGHPSLFAEMQNHRGR